MELIIINCIDTQNEITDFVNNKLNEDELEKFIEHVEKCPECMDELEVNYCLMNAMKELDSEDNNVSGDYIGDLKSKINTLKIKFKKYHKRCKNNLIILIFEIIIISLMIGININL